MQSWGLTDPGCVRKQNQDAYRIERLDKETLLGVVCDGMGGAKSGNIASTLAVEVFVEEIRRSWLPGMESDRIDQMLRSAVKLANFTVYDQAAQFEEFDGMGTTLVAVLVRRDRATVVNVGDSRCYGISNGSIRQITKDHSVVQMMVDRGEISAEEAQYHPEKHYITRALGVGGMLDVDYLEEEMPKKGAVLLCSDGLSNYLDQEDLYRLIWNNDAPSAVDQLIGQANAMGGADNITAVLIAR